MIRALLSYQGDVIELPRGDTVVGRGVSCRIRFNDPSVSREHLKFHVEGDALSVEDLGSSNGTLVNGDPISAARRLKHGDVIRIGRRVVQVSLEQGVESDQSAAAETNRHDVLTSSSESQRAELTCPSCRAWIPADADTCPSCGHAMASARPHARTRILKPGELHKERRLGRRYATSTPIFYASDALAIDAQAHDLSLSGVFVATDLFDDIGSPCTITLLPDGGAPVHVSGVVRRVVEGDAEHQSGMGVEFRALSPEAERWLIGHLQKVAG